VDRLDMIVEFHEDGQLVATSIEQTDPKPTWV